MDILGSKVGKGEHKKAAKRAFSIVYKEVTFGKWDIVVADEIVGAVSSGVLPLKNVVRLIKDKPKGLDLVLTGHHAPERLIQMADLVTEMKEVKHPYRLGILAKKGIDF